MAKQPIFYLRNTDAIFMRSDGDPQLLPDMTLTRDGWKPLGGRSPEMWADLSRLTGEDEAQQIATQIRLKWVAP